MFHWQATIGIVASLLCFFYSVPYIITILQGKTRPNRASWWIWVTIGVIICSSYYSTGGGNTIWALVCAVLAQLIIALLSLKYGEGGWNRFDKMCLFAAGISLLLWWWFNSPFIAILFNIAIDFMAALPTLKKSYYEPETENILSWTLYAAGSFLNLFTLEHWSITLSALPVYIFCVNTAIVIILLRPKMSVKHTLYKQQKWRRSRKFRHFYASIISTKRR
jgi:hypothetical protein